MKHELRANSTLVRTLRDSHVSPGVGKSTYTYGL
jgi:hypothetical protein